MFRIRSVHLRLHAESFIKFVVICWCIWYALNRVRHENYSPDPLDTVQYATQFLCLLQTFHPQPSTPLTSQQTTLQGPWTPPPVGWVKINFDASVSKHNNLCGAEAVMRNHMGFILAWARKKLPSALDVDTAESHAARLAVWLATHLDQSRIIIEGDCLQVIRGITANDTQFSVNDTVTNFLLAGLIILVVVLICWSTLVLTMRSFALLVPTVQQIL